MFVEKIIKSFKKYIPQSKLTPILNQYSPTFFLWNHLFQSAYDFISPDIKIKFDRQKVYFMDGGHVSLDWANRQKAEQGRPIILIMHGMTGGSETKYIKALVEKANQNDYCSVCLNSRGINSDMTSPIPFMGYQFHQLDKSLSRIRTSYPGNPLYLIGTSLGGNYFLRYVLNKQVQNLQGLALICPPFDVQYVIDGMNMRYQKYFIKSYIQNTVLKHEQMQFWWKNGIVDLELLKKSQNLKDFHSRITVKLLGFESSEELFSHFKITGQKIETLKVKTMILASKDDPMVGYPSFPLSAIKNNSNIDFITTEKGGHLCWFQGMIPKRWYPKPVFDFINKTEKLRKQQL